MKATINGITVEGTAQEIAEYKRLVDEQDSAKRHTHYIPSVPQWPPYKPEITCADGRTTVPLAGKYETYL